MHNLISSSKKKEYNSRILEMFNEFRDPTLDDCPASTDE